MAETMAERIKGALREAGLSVAVLAREWGVNRPALNNRINSLQIEEEELARIAGMVGRPTWWLRYGDAPAEGATTNGRTLPEYWQGVNYALLQMMERVTELQREVHDHTVPMPKRTAVTSEAARSAIEAVEIAERDRMSSRTPAPKSPRRRIAGEG